MPDQYGNMTEEEMRGQHAPNPLASAVNTWGSGPVWERVIGGQRVQMGGVSNDTEALARLRTESSGDVERGVLKPDFVRELYGLNDEQTKAYTKLHKFYNEMVDSDSSWEKIGKAARFEWDRAQNIVRQAIANPQQVLTGGVGPIGTAAANAVFGTDNRPIVGLFGGATEDDFRRYEAENGPQSLGAARSLSQAADYTAGILAAGGASNGLANLFGGSAAGPALGGGAGGDAPALGSLANTASASSAALPEIVVTGTTSNLGPLLGSTIGAGTFAANPIAGNATPSSNPLSSNPTVTGGALGGGAAAGTGSGSAATTGGASAGSAAGSATTGGGTGGGMGWNWGDIAQVGGSLLGSFLEGEGAKDASRAQIRAQREALAEQRRQFDTIVGLQEPYRNIGNQALYGMGRLYGYGPDGKPLAGGPDMSGFFTSPDYNFRRTEGNRGIENRFAARGGAQSGNALRALNEYNSNLAAGEFGDFFNRQASLAGIGQAATNATSNAAQNQANATGNYLSNMGDARASGIAGRTNAYTGGLQNLGNWFGEWYRGRQANG